MLRQPINVVAVTLTRVALLACVVAALTSLSGCWRQGATLPPVDPTIVNLIGLEPTVNPRSAHDCTRAKSELRHVFDGLADSVRDHRYGNAGLRKIDDWLLAIGNIRSLANLYEYVHPNEDIRAKSAECVQSLSDLLSEFILSKPLYESIGGLKPVSDDMVANRYQDRILRDFKLSGANRNDATRARIHKLREEILKTGQEYARNIREDRLSIQVPVEELTGLPEDYIQTRLRSGLNTIEISTDYPDYQPIMQYAQSDALRLRLLKLFLSRARDSNTAVLQRLIEKRHELASLLGYRSYAEQSLKHEMVRSPDIARAFIDDVSEMAAEASQRDYGHLLQALREIQPEATSVGRWQASYLENIIRQERFNLDQKQVRTYFRYEKVKRGIFQLVEDLFAVSVRPARAATWHEDVEAYEIYDGRQLLGRFFIDMHPRPGKYQHAAHFSIRTGTKGRQLPMAALICNFPLDRDHPDGAYMEHGQVETFLHEFGHLLHSILGGHQAWSLLSGIATEHDFVEAPSQMLEEWIWDAESLQSFAHNDQGEPLPLEMLEKMNAARHFGRGLWVRNQMFYAALSLYYYDTPPEELDLLQDMVRLQHRYAPLDYVEDTYFYASFGHLNGYAAAYYTYMWSLLIATDLFSEFEKKGLRNAEVAMRYRRQILEPGGTMDAAVLVRNFLGRDYNIEAFKRFVTPPSE
jgi:thimet oligopeptidase